MITLLSVERRRAPARRLVRINAALAVFAILVGSMIAMACRHHGHCPDLGAPPAPGPAAKRAAAALVFTLTIVLQALLGRRCCLQGCGTR